MPKTLGKSCRNAHAALDDDERCATKKIESLYMMCKTFDVVELSTQLEGLVASSKLTKLFYDSYLGT